MENQHRKSNQLSLLNIVVIVYYLCLFVGTKISIRNFWTNGENEVLNQLWVIPACTPLLLAAIWWLSREAFATSATYLRRCFACMTLVYVITFITRIVPTDYTEVSVQTMIVGMAYSVAGIIAFVASIMISVRLMRHYTGSKHTLGIVIIAGLVINILCSLVQGIYPIVAEADVQTVKTVHSACTVISTAIFAVTVYYLHTIVKETEAAKLSTGTEETGETV
ncbi:hypothetical protein [Leyella stercorea]|uniref:hypothetical protein n=1 Tax=Leyella stercorea TaxID=363265 RepID=UPI001A4E3263|nr:hypothetical protein [Leyella stercorea]MBL6517777.1 hypothetical protein [Leyella stercorea]